jgi:Arginine repressor
MGGNQQNGKGRTKQERQEALMDLIASGQYRTQEEIVRAFVEKGLDKIFRVSQSTVSRDLQELGITRTDEGVYMIEPALAQDRKKDALAAMLAASNAKVHYPVSFFCVKCDEGYERLLATRIREAYAAEVVGTVTESGMVVVFASGGEEDGAARRLAAEIGGFLG